MRREGRSVQLVLAGLLTVVSIAWIDYPVAQLASEIFGTSSGRWCSAAIADVALPAGLLGCFFLGARSFLGRSLSRREIVVFLSCASIACAAALNAGLELVFARHDPL